MYYTYVYTDPERNVPIYVGKGKENRAFKHLKRNSVNPRFRNRLKVLKRNGLEPIIEIFDAANEEAAHKEEIRLIALFGRKDLSLGSLYNLTDGGEGISNPSEETRKKMSVGIRASYTPELRAFRSSSQKGKSKSDNAKSAMKLSAKSRWMSEEGVLERKKLSDAGYLRTGEKNGRSKIWTVLAPNGEVFTTLGMSKFCEDHNLSYYGLRNKAVTSDTTPVSRGISKGWSVLSCVGR